MSQKQIDPDDCMGHRWKAKAEVKKTEPGRGNESAVLHVQSQR